MKKKLLALCLVASLISMNVMSVLAAEDMPIPTENEEAAVGSEVQPYAGDGSELQEDAAEVPETQAETTEVTETEETEAEGTETPESDVVASGKYWNTEWELTSDGVLTIFGTGEMARMENLGISDYKDQVKSVVIEEGVTSISYMAFSGWNSLTSVEIPGSVTEVGYSTFNKCSSLQNVKMAEGVTRLNWYAFGSCTSLTSIEIPDSVTYMRGTFVGCTSLASVKIPDGVTDLMSAFFGCTALTSVNLPAGLTSIYGTFGNCTSLTSVEIPESVTEIGAYTFSGCTALKSVTIPDSVTSIGEGAFMDCSALTDLKIPTGVTSIEHSAFNGCSSLTSVAVPKVTNIEYRAFANCTSLAQVSIPDSVKSIEYEAFANCTNLSSVTFKGDAPELKERSIRLSYDEEQPSNYTGSVFRGVKATICYPLNNATWTSDVKNKYGENANLAWARGDSSYAMDPSSINVTYKAGSGDGLPFRCYRPSEDFVSASVDGALVDPSNYTVKEGSTILTFTDAFLSSLSAGKHVLLMNYKDGYGPEEVPFNIEKDGSESGGDGNNGQDNNGAPTSPKTGDAADLWGWMAVLAVLSGSVLACSKLYRTHRQ